MKPNQVATLARVVRQIGVALLGTDFNMSGDRHNRWVGVLRMMAGKGLEAIKVLRDEIADRGGNVHLLIASKARNLCGFSS